MSMNNDVFESEEEATDDDDESVELDHEEFITNVKNVRRHVGSFLIIKILLPPRSNHSLSRRYSTAVNTGQIELVVRG